MIAKIAKPIKYATQLASRAYKSSPDPKALKRGFARLLQRVHGPSTKSLSTNRMYVARGVRRLRKKYGTEVARHLVRKAGQ